jgi:hypothetical protein
MSVDFPRAWQIAKETSREDHNPKCSYAQTKGALLCDCGVLTKHPEYLSDDFAGNREKTMKSSLETYLKHAEEVMLTKDEKDRLLAAVWTDDEVYLRLKICRDVLIHRIQNKIIEDFIMKSANYDEKKGNLRLAACREERKHLNWIQNMIDKREQVFGGGENPMDALARVWMDAINRVK